MVGAPSSPSLQDTFLLNLISGIETHLRYSARKKCSQIDTMFVNSLYDTRIQFKVSGVSFYHNDLFVGESNRATFKTAVSGSVVDEIPILIFGGIGDAGNIGSHPCISAGGNIENAGSGSRSDDLINHIAHELGHVFGLYHLYYAGINDTNSVANPNNCTCYTPSNMALCKPASTPEKNVNGILDCNDEDYLSDVFSPNNPYRDSISYPKKLISTVPCFDANGNPSNCGQAVNCYNPPLNSCNTNYEVDAFCTNNLMGANGVFFLKFGYLHFKMEDALGCYTYQA